jgi:hypothetical protein
MTVVEQIYKDIEITFDIHDPVRKYFESRRGEWLEKEKQQIVMAHEQGLQSCDNREKVNSINEALKKLKQ